MVVRFSSVCDATWPTTSPVTSARAPLAGEPFRDPEHQTAVEDDTKLGWDREQDLLLKLAEGNEHQARPQLMPRQQRRNLADLLL